MKFARDSWQIESAIAKGRDLPDWYIKEPPELPCDEFYISSYFDLMSCKNYEGGPLPWDKIRQYAVEYKQLDQDLLELFTSVMYALDAAFQKEMRRQQDKK